MRRAAFATVLCALGAPLPAQAVSETEEGFAAAMQGCWTQTRWGEEIEKLRADPDFTITATMCFEGGVTGQIDAFYCDGRPHIDCWDSHPSYAFKDKKLWRYFEEETPDGQAVSCDVRLVPGKQVQLHGCLGHAADGSVVRMLDDAVYERQVTP